jgi:hypothetical protein
MLYSPSKKQRLKMPAAMLILKILVYQAGTTGVTMGKG